MDYRTLLVSLLLLMGAGSVAAPSTTAQDMREPPLRYDLNVQGEPLQDALERLQQLANLPLLYAPQLPEGKRSVCVIEEAVAEDVLDCVLEGTGLRARRLDSGTYTIEEMPEDATLSGFVKDAASGVPLPGATVVIPGTDRGTVSNRYGYYSINVPAGTYPLMFSYVGYKTRRDTFTIEGNISAGIRLSPKTVQLDPLTVEGSRARIQARKRPGISYVSPRAIRQLPALLGASDALKTLQRLPGVAFGTEGTSGLHVRGGSADQNKILLDGIPLHHTSHLLGILSSFNPDVLERMTLFKGAYPAKYGGRLSSVVDVNLRDANRQEYNLEGAVGLLSSRVLVEGPIQRGKTAFLVAGRRSYFDLALLPLQPIDGGTVAPYFYDINGKVSHILSPSDRLYLNLYTSRDRAALNAPVDNLQTEFTWANMAGSIRWNHLFSDQLLSNVRLTYSRFGFYGDLTVDDSHSIPFEYYYRTRIRDIGLRSDIEYFPSPAHGIQFGVEGHAKQFLPGRADFEEGSMSASGDSLMNAADYSTLRGALYAEDAWQMSDRLLLTLGLRAEAYGVEGTSYLSLQPRLSARYNLLSNLTLRAAYSGTRQFQHRLAGSTLILLPFDLWAPATAVTPPARARLASAEIAFEPGHGNYQVEAGAFYKKMEGLAEYGGIVPFTNIGRNFEQHVSEGEGRSYGLEFLLRRRSGPTTGWLAYTLSWTNRRFDGLNDGEPFPFRYDRRHMLNLSVMHRLSGSFALSAAWTYATGQAITVPSGHYWGPSGGAGTSSLVYAPSRNNYRMPPYHRLDLGATWDVGRNHTLAFGAYNVYNRVNPVVIQRRHLRPGEPGEPGEGPLVNKGLGVLPILPYVQYRFKIL